MSELSIQQILSSRYRTSQVADRHTVTLMEGLGLSTKANVARLCIGRSLAMGPLLEEGIDAKGLEIPAASLFTQEDIGVWVGMVVTHAQMNNASPIETMDSFRAAVRMHWHRGAQLMMDDWRANDEDFDRFLETLINRRAELPTSAKTPKGNDEEATGEQEKPKDVSAELVKALADIGVTADVKGFTHGPRVTRYRVFLSDVNHLPKLQRGMDRLSLVLGLQGAIPTVTLGDEARLVFLDIPRLKATWETVPFAKLREWTSAKASDPDELHVFPGVDILGAPFSLNLASSLSPHLLVGGATGQGKSVCLHALILSLMMQHTPASMRVALIDPKRVEFSVYEGNEYLWGDDVALGIGPARERLLDLVSEMDSRYETFREIGVTNIIEARAKGVKLPFIVAFIEELADLVIQDRDLETQIVRLAQLARAAGIHLVLATQRPDAKTFSGLVRSNIPARIALKVQKSSESSIILDETGAESLLGEGDMLVKITGDPVRVHGVYVRRREIESFLS
ncbi:DNA translocase FtsK [Magnetovibrio sp.]|uniref:DNA translocase FtsK n=1 Tax=Magnetovibrio sp. TaxID=2024836 RepID=UPI002F93E801